MWRLEDNDAARSGDTLTLAHCMNEARVVKPILRIMNSNNDKSDECSISAEAVRRACGIMYTNCYEVGGGGLSCRALYETVSRVNHSCLPNCYRRFASDADQEFGTRMVVFAARDIAAGEEITVCYTPTLLSTPQRQATFTFSHLMLFLYD